jgi:hypothetical protein
MWQISHVFISLSRMRRHEAGAMIPRYITAAERVLVLHLSSISAGLDRSKFLAKRCRPERRGNNDAGFSHALSRATAVTS